MGGDSQHWVVGHLQVTPCA